MERYNIGIIGYGGFGKFLHSSWSSMQNAKVVAVADQNPDINITDELEHYQDWRLLIKDANIDIVSIATPPARHVEMACAALKNNKHILVEKPLALTKNAAQKIIDARNNSGKIASVDYMLRFNPIVEVLSRLSRENAFGELRRVDVENYAQDSSLPGSHWFWDPSISGGILVEHAVHFIDLVHFLTDQKFVKVTGMSHKRNEIQKDQMMANVVYNRGLIATHFHSFTRPDFFEDTSIRLCFDLAQIDLHGWIPLSGAINVLANNRTENALKQLPGYTNRNSENLTEHKIKSRGIEYVVRKMVSGTFNVGIPKLKVYADCVRKMMHDIICSIENPDHARRVRMEDGQTSLEIADRATKYCCIN